MTCAVLRCEHAESYFHQIVAAILLTVTLKLRCLAGHEVGLLNGVDLGRVETLQLHVLLRLLEARMQVVGEEHGTLLVLADIIDGAVAALVGRNQAILVAIENHRLHVVIVFHSLLHKLIVVSRERLEVYVEAKLA